MIGSDTKNLVLVIIFDPIFLKKPHSNFLKTLGQFFIPIGDISLSLKNNLHIKNSNDSWWKNFLCLDGAFSKFIFALSLLKNFTDNIIFLKKILEKSNNRRIFFTKINFFVFFLYFFCILKWLFSVILTIKFYLL